MQAVSAKLKELGAAGSKWFAVSLHKETWNAMTPLARTTIPVRLAVELPEDLIQAGRYFYIIGCRDGKAEVMVQGTSLTGTWMTDQASTYLIAYKDAETLSPGDAKLRLDADLKVSWKGSKITAKWGKVPGATEYAVYASYSGKKYKKVSTVTGTSANIKKLGGKKLKKKKIVRLYVVAYADGKELAKSIPAFVAGPGNTKYTNAKKVKVSAASVSVKTGKSTSISPKATLADSKKKSLPKKYVRAFRYASSDTKVAAVDKNGKVTAKGAGTCLIYAYAQNGMSAKIKVSVK